MWWGESGNGFNISGDDWGGEGRKVWGTDDGCRERKKFYFSLLSLILSEHQLNDKIY